MSLNYYFDICALCILSTIAVTSLSRRSVPAYRQRAYGLLLFAVFTATIAERIETHLQLHPVSTVWFSVAEKASGSVYFLAHLGSAFCYLLYILSVLDIYVSINDRKNVIRLFLGYGIGVILVVVNLFYPVLFHYDGAGLYHRDFWIWIYYILAVYYLGAGLYFLLRYSNLVRFKTKLIIVSYIIFVVIGIALQFFYPSLLIENFCNTVSVTLVYITLQNPSEMVDDKLNILNGKAFAEGLDLKIKRKSPHCTIFVTIDNMSALSSELGYKQSQNVVKNVVNYLKNVGIKESGLQTYAYRYSEFVFAITVHTKDSLAAFSLMEKIASRLAEPWNVTGMTIRVEAHCFLMRYPENYLSSAELMSKIDIITEDIADKHSVIIDVDGKEYKKIKKSHDFDALARENLENKKANIKYQPILSKVYKINYTVDVVCYFYDEKNNEIDIRKHVPDSKLTQTLMDTDEFVYRSACRALSFWNGGDKNGKYRAVVGLSQGEISKNDFIRRIKKILREEKAEASWISLKLTETTITTMNSIAERNIKLMGELGSYVIVDRFGSGYGDLQRILSLPVLQINIDPSVLKTARESEQMKIVAHGIVNLFHDVSIFVGASELQTEEDKAMAEELECDYLMGDYMGVPVSDSSFVKVIDAYFEEG